MQSKQYNNGYYIIARLFRDHIKHKFCSIVKAVVFMIITAITTAINAYLMQPILDKVFIDKKYFMLIVIPSAILINNIIRSISTFYQSYIMKLLEQDIITNMQMKLYETLMYADIGFFNHYPHGKLISRFTNDINMMRKNISDVFSILVVELMTLIALIIVMLYYSCTLTLIVLVIFPLAFFIVTFLGKKIRDLAFGIQKQLGGFTVRLDESFQNIPIIKSYCRERYEISRTQNVIEKFKSIYRKSAFTSSISTPIMELVSGIAIVVVVVYGGMQVINNQITTGAFFAFVVALFMTHRPLKTFSALNSSIQEGIAAAKRVFMIMDEKQEIIDSGIIVPLKSYDIVFREVCFAYKNTEKGILNNLNMVIPQGKTIALVGESGVGKSTVFNLLLRFYEPYSGEITIGDYDIRTIKISQLRHMMALVSQEPHLFDDTIAQNIRYGNLEASEDGIINAAKIAAAHDFIMSFNEGYNTRIGRRGIGLSVGQKQRITIARAILKNSPILLLDEATSALDNISERQIQEALENLKRGKTTIVIAHRLSTIESADIIYLIVAGRVMASGTHKELLNSSKEYFKLYKQYRVTDISK